MMKKLFTFLTIALSIMQLYAQQTEIRRSEYRSMDDDGNFINVVQLEIGGRYFYDIDENTHTAIFKRWYGRENDTELIIPASISNPQLSLSTSFLRVTRPLITEFADDFFNDIISIGELIKSVKEGNVGIKKIAERSGYAFRGRYHDPELNDFYYEDVYYKNCLVAADGSPIKYGNGNSSVLIAGSVGFGPFVSIRVYNKCTYNHIKSELRNKFHFKTVEVAGKWTTLNKWNVVVDVSVDGNAYGFTFYIK